MSITSIENLISMGGSINPETGKTDIKKALGSAPLPVFALSFKKNVTEIVFIVLGIGLILGGLFMAKDFGKSAVKVTVQEAAK